MNNETQKYISDAKTIINILSDSKNGITQEQMVNDPFLISCTTIQSQKEADFLHKLLADFKLKLLYPKSDCTNTFLEQLKKEFDEKIEITDEQLTKIALIADLFIFFTADSTIAGILSSHKKLALGSPFNDGMSNIEAKKYYLENSSFLKYFAETKNIQKQVVTEFDVYAVLVGDVLKNEDFDKYSNSNHKGEEQYLLYLQLFIKNRNFLWRVQEINHLHSKYSLHLRDSAKITENFINCL